MLTKRRKEAKCLFVLELMSVCLCTCVCACLCPLLRKAVNKSPNSNVRYYLRAKQKDKADTATSERSRGSKEERQWEKVDWHQ